jgi:membrane-bound lytic murein transglycosylase D
LVPRKGELDADVTEHLADNAQMAFAPEVVLKRITLKARKGDTLASFASKHGVTVANLMSWNKLNMNAPLKAGQSIILLIPTTQGRYMAKGLQNKTPISRVAVKAPVTVAAKKPAPPGHTQSRAVGVAKR